MMVSKENIEFKIFEYHEGLLNPQEQAEVLNFIKINPEYQLDFDAMEKSYLKDEEFVYKHVNELLMPEQQAAKSFFGWRLGMSVFLISLLSFGVYYKINTNNIISTEANNLVNTSPSMELVNHNNKHKTIQKGLQNQNSNLVHTKSSELSNLTVSSTQVALQKNPLRNVIQLAANDLSIISNGNSSNNFNNQLQNLDNDKISKKFSNLTIKNKSFDNSIGLKELQPLRKKLHYKEPKDMRVKFVNSKDQFYANEEGTYLSLNSSFAGNTDGLRVEYYYRTEWPQINNGNYVTQFITIDTYSKLLKGGVGGFVERDIIGHNTFNTTSYGLFYSPKIKVSDKLSVEPSVKFAHTNRSIQWNQINEFMITDPRDGFTHVKGDGAIGDVSSSTIRFNTIGLGILINHKNFFIGGSVDKLNDVSYDFNNLSKNITLPTLISAQFGTELKPNNESPWTFVPSINYVQFGEWERLWLNNQIKFKKVMLGAGLAHNNAYIFNFGYVDRIVRLVYSYGLSQPPVGLNSYYGSHQISLRLNFLPVK
jgi:type IX secretion system PorP/SprF family membrane protein